MKFRIIHIESTTSCFDIEADSLIQARARASCGSIGTVLGREGVLPLITEKRIEVFHEKEEKPFAVNSESVDHKNGTVTSAAY